MLSGNINDIFPLLGVQGKIIENWPKVKFSSSRRSLLVLCPGCSFVLFCFWFVCLLACICLHLLRATTWAGTFQCFVWWQICSFSSAWLLDWVSYGLWLPILLLYIFLKISSFNVSLWAETLSGAVRGAGEEEVAWTGFLEPGLQRLAVDSRCAEAAGWSPEQFTLLKEDGMGWVSVSVTILLQW